MLRVLWVALLLAHDLLEASIPADVLARAARDREAVALAGSVPAPLFNPPPAYRFQSRRL
jgi:hypothetical protein